VQHEQTDQFAVRSQDKMNTRWREHIGWDDDTGELRSFSSGLAPALPSPRSLAFPAAEAAALCSPNCATASARRYVSCVFVINMNEFDATTSTIRQTLAAWQSIATIANGAAQWRRTNHSPLGMAWHGIARHCTLS
jgi:hypothetical protein